MSDVGYSELVRAYKAYSAIANQLCLEDLGEHFRGYLEALYVCQPDQIYQQIKVFGYTVCSAGRKGDYANMGF